MENKGRRLEYSECGAFSGIQWNLSFAVIKQKLFPTRGKAYFKDYSFKMS